MTTREASLLQRAREAAGLSVDVLARFTDIPGARLHDAERGDLELSIEELDRCTQIFGVETEATLQTSSIDETRGKSGPIMPANHREKTRDSG